MPAARKPPAFATLVAIPAYAGALTSFAHAHEAFAQINKANIDGQVRNPFGKGTRPRLGLTIVILGHTHYQMAHRVGRVLVINPGSAGEPRDPRNDFQLSFAVLDTESDEVRFGSFPDPTRIVAAQSGEPVTNWTTVASTSTQDGATGFGYDRAPQTGPDPWTASLNT